MPIKSIISYQGSRVPGKGTVVNRISELKHSTLKHWMGGDQKPLSFDWSYPSQSTIALAMALLADALGGHGRADSGLIEKLVNKFARDVVEEFAFDEWKYTRLETLAWIERNTPKPNEVT